MRSLQEIAEDLYALVKEFVCEAHLEVHEANKLATLANEVDAWADRLEDDGK